MTRTHYTVAGFLPIAASILLLLGHIPANRIHAGETTITYTHTERSLQPGEVVLFRARSNSPLKGLKVEMFDRSYHGFPDDEGLDWTCLVGIDRDCKPGRYGIKLIGAGMDGKNAAASGALEVAAKKFPTRKLTVDSKYVTPPADVLERIEKEQARVASIFASTTPERFWNGSFQAPVPGEVISAFGKLTVYNGQPRSAHSGTDFRGSVGTPIRAPNAGCVVLTGDLYYSGKTVILDHGLGLYSYMGHMSAIAVKEGDRVETGIVIGNVGATGRVTGPHLHWTVRLSESRVDPISLLDVLSARKQKGK